MMADVSELVGRLERRRRRQTWLNTLMVLGLVAAFVAVGMLMVARSDIAARVGELAQRADSNATTAIDNAAAADALAEQVRSLGQTPVVDTARLPEPSRTQRPPGPTRAQIAAAVAAYCAGGRCAAPGPTPEQVAAAVEAFCGGDRCRGESGDEGQDAEEGPTGDDIAAAVAAYCAERDQCAGPRGEPGADGSAGVDGAPGRPPAGFDFTDGDGTTYRCTPDTPPEPGTSPQYTCRAQESPPEPGEQPPPDDDGPLPGG